MKNSMIRMGLFAALLVVAGGATLATVGFAEGDIETISPGEVVYDRARGELSIGTKAPTRAAMVEAIQRSSPTRLEAMLEYGERVECHACVPLLERKLLESEDRRVREISAWWLRRRLFAIGKIMTNMIETLQSDTDPVRRARAAEALGEFLSPAGFEPLAGAYRSDPDPAVRTAVVHAIGRLNQVRGNELLAEAMSDASADVRKAALDNVLLVNFFREHEALIGRLADEDAVARRKAARLSGELGIAEAVPALSALLRGDGDPSVRQAAAWALGKIGGSDARSVLSEVRAVEGESLVLDAIDIALSM